MIDLLTIARRAGLDTSGMTFGEVTMIVNSLAAVYDKGLTDGITHAYVARDGGLRSDAQYIPVTES